MDQSRSKLCQRCKYKPPEMKARMRQCEKLCVTAFVLIEEEVHVECSGPPAHRPSSTQPILDPKQPGHQLCGFRKNSAQFHYHIQKMGLIYNIERFCLINP
jgi:hypothetical protein